MARILIVDDSRTSRRVLRKHLEEAGHDVIGEAENGQRGVELYEELKPDVTTMDITMPVMDGIESLRNIKSKDSAAIIIMVTAAGQTSKMMEAVKLGAAEFIAKPYEPSEICLIIEKVMEAAGL